MLKLTHQNLDTVRAGDRLIIDYWVGKVEKDLKFNGGLKCGGRSLLNILDEEDNVELVRFVSQGD